MSFDIKPATRAAVKPLVGLFSESGCGKTMSALLLARGFAGPNGKVVLADSESGRGSMYADVIPGGFETFDLCEPFTPARYIEAVVAMEQSGAAIGVIDSVSHEWEGISGVLDMAGENEQRSGKAGLHNWKTPKLEHAKFVQRLLRSSIPLIVCLRAKFKSRQTKNDQGKTVIIKDDFTSPIQAEDFIYEMSVHGEIMPDHSFRLTKQSHPTLGSCFPSKAPISVDHGAALAKWCQSPGKPVSSQPVTAGDPLKELTAKLWSVLKPVRGTDKTWNSANQWLWRHEILDAAAQEAAPKLSELRLRHAITKSAEVLASEGVTP